MRIVAISDTHTAHSSVTLPEGDVLVHAGDISGRGSLNDILEFDMWLGKQDFKHKLVISGNHDFCFERYPDTAKLIFKNATYLQDSGVDIEGVKFWGTPWQPWFHDWAFNLRTEAERQEKWDLIPEFTNVLITHGPPHGYGDMVRAGENVGCKALAKKIIDLEIELVVTGHIHESYGEYDMGNSTKVINASIMDLSYNPVNAPIVFDM